MSKQLPLRDGYNFGSPFGLTARPGNHGNRSCARRLIHSHQLGRSSEKTHQASSRPQNSESALGNSEKLYVTFFSSSGIVSKHEMVLGNTITVLTDIHMFGTISTKGGREILRTKGQKL